MLIISYHLAIQTSIACARYCSQRCLKTERVLASHFGQQIDNVTGGLLRKLIICRTPLILIRNRFLSIPQTICHSAPKSPCLGSFSPAQFGLDFSHSHVRMRHRTDPIGFMFLMTPPPWNCRWTRRLIGLHPSQTDIVDPLGTAACALYS